MTKKSANPTKNKRAVCPKCSNNFNMGLFIGCLLGFAAGAGIVAVYDYLDEKHNEMRRIKKGSDENYLYTAE